MLRAMIKSRHVPGWWSPSCVMKILWHIPGVPPNKLDIKFIFLSQHGIGRNYKNEMHTWLNNWLVKGADMINGIFSVGSTGALC